MIFLYFVQLIGFIILLTLAGILGIDCREKCCSCHCHLNGMFLLVNIPSDIIDGKGSVMSRSPDEILATVKKSPEIVAVHNKNAWLGLFSRNAVVQDPVGTPRNRKGVDINSKTGDDELGRFYELFIAKNNISFTVYMDIIVGYEVVRDVLIRTELSTGIVVEVPAYLIYNTLEEDGELKVESLAAHWELANMTKQVTKMGFKGIYSTLVSSWNMFKIQGLKWMMGYSDGMKKGIFEQGYETVYDFEKAVNEGNGNDLIGLFDSPESCIEFPVGTTCIPGEFLKDAGPDIHIDIIEPRSAGWWTSCRCNIKQGDTENKGLAFFEFNPESKKIVKARFFWKK